MTSLDIVNLITNNPITKLNANNNNKLLENGIINIIEESNNKISYQYKNEISTFILFDDITVTIYRQKDIFPFKIIV